MCEEEVYASNRLTERQERVLRATARGEVEWHPQSQAGRTGGGRGHWLLRGLRVNKTVSILAEVGLIERPLDRSYRAPATLTDPGRAWIAAHPGAANV